MRRIGSPYRGRFWGKSSMMALTMARVTCMLLCDSDGEEARERGAGGRGWWGLACYDAGTE